jgi:hypothetical protein
MSLIFFNTVHQYEWAFNINLTEQPHEMCIQGFLAYHLHFEMHTIMFSN